MKKGDIKIIIAIVALVILAYGYMFYLDLSADQVVLRITQNQQVLYEFKLDENYQNRLLINDGAHYNEVIINGYDVYVGEANCLNQVCVNHGKISNVGESIVCIPHKLVIELIGSSSDLDVIVE